ncbi:hypothetical protein V5799_012732 [Amblyomma americanum]|uniref:Uncharacterized protein n=1 Tax=Amblyomma americanum TaxID=6943 RepID=A0AAQ4E7Z2_AMBAM
MATGVTNSKRLDAADSEVRHEIYAEAATNQAQDEPVQAAAVGTTTGGEQKPRRIGEPATLGASAPTAADQADSTTAGSVRTALNRTSSQRWCTRGYSPR